MHQWGEEDFDWDGLDDAGTIIGKFCRRWGRFGGQIKEKFGTLRFYVCFTPFDLHTLFYPGYMYCQFPKWLATVDWKLRETIFRPLHRPFYWWQVKVYNWAYQRALKRHAALRKEILICADYPELIKGGKDF